MINVVRKTINYHTSVLLVSPVYLPVLVFALISGRKRELLPLMVLMVAKTSLNLCFITCEACKLYELFFSSSCSYIIMRDSSSSPRSAFLLIEVESMDLLRRICLTFSSRCRLTDYLFFSSMNFTVMLLSLFSSISLSRCSRINCECYTNWSLI